MSQRREDILSAALQLFNKKGIDQVTTRDIAKEINISQGNLTYHFPNKNDIVFALVGELSKAIDEALSSKANEPSENTLSLYYRQAEIVFTTQLKYKFLFGRWGEIISSSPEIQKFAQEFLKIRFTSWHQVHTQLVKEKLASSSLVEDSHAQAYIVNMLSLFWHQEFAMYFPNLNDKQKVKMALSIVFQSYKPYLTKKGLTILKPLQMKLDHY